MCHSRYLPRKVNKNRLQALTDYAFPLTQNETYRTERDPFHLQKILEYGTDLRNTGLPVEQRAKAVESIGLLIYTGTKSSRAYNMFDLLFLHFKLSLLM